jgi:hypothetical protein
MLHTVLIRVITVRQPPLNSDLAALVQVLFRDSRLLFPQNKLVPWVSFTRSPLAFFLKKLVARLSFATFLSLPVIFSSGAAPNRPVSRTPLLKLFMIQKLNVATKFCAVIRKCVL